MMWQEILLLLIILAVALTAVLNMRWGVFVPALCKIFTTSKQVVLTFDDGPDPNYTPKLLDLFKEKGINATFFLVGENAEKYPEIVKRISDEGHRIGIHCYYHKPKFVVSKKKDMLSELKRTKALLENITGREITLFRPPFGATNPNVASSVRELDLKTVGCTIRSLDNINKPQAWVLARIEKYLTEGAIILVHDNVPGCISLVENIILLLDRKGYSIVKL